MAEYGYIAVAKDGKEVKGSLQAKDTERVRAKLKNDGLIPISIKEQSLLNKDINISFGNPVKPRELGIFCRQFASLLVAGIAMSEALNMLAEQTDKKVFKKAIQETRSSVEKGETLGNSMRANKKVFPPMLINMVDAGELSGSLEVSFTRMAVQFEKGARVKGLVKKAMIYPVVLICVAIVVVIGMAVFVVPRFAAIFEDLGTELPAMTNIIMVISDFFIYRWYIALAVVAGFIVGFRVFAKTELGETYIGFIKIKIPIFGKLSVKNYSAQFARTLSTLTSAGISITEAIEITSKSINNILFKRALIKAKKEVEQGVLLSDPIRKCGLFPTMVHHMLHIGEETGNMEAMLDKCADYFEEEVEITTQSLTALMEPLIIVVLGVVVAILVLAMYQPMISMYGDMGNL